MEDVVCGLYWRAVWLATGDHLEAEAHVRKLKKNTEIREIREEHAWSTTLLALV